MTIRIEIVADNFGEMIEQLGGAVKMFVPVPASAFAQPQPTDPITPDASAEPEIISPPRKPNSKKRQAVTIEGTVNTETPAAKDPEPETTTKEAPAQAVTTTKEAPATGGDAAGAPKVLDFEKDIRPAIVAHVNDEAKKTPDDPTARKKVFDKLLGFFSVTKSTELKPEQYQSVIDYIATFAG